MRRHLCRAIAPFLLVSAIGCDHREFEETSTDASRLEVSENVEVRVRLDNGRIIVEPGASGVVEVTVEKRARSLDRAMARALLEQARVDIVQTGDVIAIDSSASITNRISPSGRIRTDVTLSLPPSVSSLDLYTSDGRIVLAGVSGSISASTGDGRVRASDLSGQLRLRSGDGSIVATAIAGDVDVSTDDGRIVLDGAFRSLRAVTFDGSVRIECDSAPLDADWSIRSLDGSIKLEVPADFNATIEATSIDGRVVNNLSRFEGSKRRRYVSGTLGNGGPLIVVTAMDGRVTLDDR